MQASSVARGDQRLGIRSYPISLTFELTWLCNLACSYCDRHTPMRHEMSREEIFSALDQAYALGMRRTNLDGGEPHAPARRRDRGPTSGGGDVEVNLNSNGILVPKKIETVRRLSRLKISVDGPRESHDAMRGKDSFERALAGAEAAGSRGAGRVHLRRRAGTTPAASRGSWTSLRIQVGVAFQPALNSLFLETECDGSAWQLETEAMRAAFARIEYLLARAARGQRLGQPPAFPHFPEETRPPCAAGWSWLRWTPKACSSLAGRSTAAIAPTACPGWACARPSPAFLRTDAGSAGVPVSWKPTTNGPAS